MKSFLKFSLLASATTVIIVVHSQTANASQAQTACSLSDRSLYPLSKTESVLSLAEDILYFGSRKNM